MKAKWINKLFDKRLKIEKLGQTLNKWEKNYTNFLIDGLLLNKAFYNLITFLFKCAFTLWITLFTFT